MRAAGFYRANMAYVIESGMSISHMLISLLIVTILRAVRIHMLSPVALCDMVSEYMTRYRAI